MTIPESGDRRVRDRDDGKKAVRWGVTLVIAALTATAAAYLVLTRAF